MSANIDRAFVGMALMTYFVAAVVLLPRDGYLYGVGVAALLFIGAASLARRRSGYLGGAEFLYVVLGSALMFVMPTMPAMGGEGGISTPIAVVASQIFVMTWTVPRWDYAAYQPTTLFSLAAALKTGAMAAALLSAVAVVPIAVGFLFAAREVLPLLGVFPAYIVGCLSAATAAWLLQRVAHLAVGRYWLGVFGGACLYLAVMPIVVLSRGDDGFSLLSNIGAGYFCGALVGPCVAVAWREEPA